MLSRLEDHPWLWVMLGPMLVVFTLLLATFHLGAGALYLPLLAAVGIPLVALLGEKGLYASWALLVGSMPFYNSPWQVGAAISISLGLWVAHLVAGDFDAKRSQTSTQELELQEKLDLLQEQFEAACAEAERLVKLDRVKMSELGALQEERNLLLSDLLDMRAAFVAEAGKEDLSLEVQERHRQELHAVRSQLNALRIEGYQARLEAESYLASSRAAQQDVREAFEAVAEAQAKLGEGAQALREKEKRILELQERLSKASEADHRLRQLKGQFRERNEVIHHARKELWQTESEALHLKHERDERELSPDAAVDALVGDLSWWEEKEGTLKEEKAALEDLVDGLLAELKGRSVPSFVHVTG